MVLIEQVQQAAEGRFNRRLLDAFDKLIGEAEILRLLLEFDNVFINPPANRREYSRKLRTDIAAARELHERAVKEVTVSLVQERDELQRQLDEVCDMLSPEWRGKFTLKQLVKENIESCHEQARQLAELRKDTERLDWLDGDNWWDFCRSANPSSPADNFHLDVGQWEDCRVTSKPSAREAIDVARIAQEQEVKE